MRRFDYRFLKQNIGGDLFGLANVISGLNAREQIRKSANPGAFEALREQAIIASVRGSNAIEGIVTTEERLLAIARGSAPLSHDEKEISGYRDALQYIHTNSDRLDMTEETLLLLHRMIEAEVNPTEVGRFKTRDNLIMEYSADGTKKVRFRPIPAQETAAAVEQLVLAYIDARQDSSIPAILLIPCVVVDFLCIHPFTDGNGRVSRLLTLLLMYISGYDVGRFISYEDQVNQNRDAYYSALQKSSENWHENANDYTPFVFFHLQIVYRCFKMLDDSFAAQMSKGLSKAARVRLVLDSATVPVSKAEIMERLPGVGVKTVEAELARMLAEGRLTKIGTYKNARYVKKG